MLGFGEAEGGSEAFGVVGSADDIVQPHGGAEQAHVLVGGTRMHGREKLFAVFLGVGDVNQPYRGFADKALPGEEVAQVGGADLFEAVFRGVVEPCSVAAEDVDFKILPILGRGDGPFSVGAVHAVRGPEQIAERFVARPLSVCMSGFPPLVSGGGNAREVAACAVPTMRKRQAANTGMNRFVIAWTPWKRGGLGGMASVRRKDAGYHGVVTDWKYA